MSLQIVQNQQLKPIGDKVPIDTTLSSSSENAISNKAVTEEITRINSDLSGKLGTDWEILIRTSTGGSYTLLQNRKFLDYKYLLLLPVQDDTRRINNLLIPRSLFIALTENVNNYWGADWYDGVTLTRLYSLIGYRSDTTVSIVTNSYFEVYGIK